MQSIKSLHQQTVLSTSTTSRNRIRQDGIRL